MSAAVPTSSISAQLELKITQANESGKKFAEVFYEKLDKNRHTMGQLFHDSVKLVWNGNPYEGKGNVLEFYGNLPITATNLMSIDAQPLSTIISKEATSILVTCMGRMSFNKKSKFFTESFMLTAENNVWKVATDTYRSF